MTETTAESPQPFDASSAPGPWSAERETEALKFLASSPGDEAVARLIRHVSAQWGIQRAHNLVLRWELISGIRKRPAAALFDHTLHLVGGGQKYGCTIAHVLQNFCDVTLLSNRPVSREQLEEWYSLDLSGCRTETIAIPFFERPEFGQIDPGIITVRDENPFHPVSHASGRFDLFINNSMLEMVFPLSNLSVFMCHFPERRRSRYFYVDRYGHLMYNSRYTAGWIRRKWSLEPTLHVFPPADMEIGSDPAPKEPLILSVARFEPGGTKQQDRMIEAFSRLASLHPEQFKGWKLILAGGSPVENPFLERIRAMTAECPGLPLEVLVNIPAGELRSLYERASIFWHLCGLRQSDPSRVEHFGMTIVEAMQNGCVPVVFDGGGQREIVEHGVSGFRFARRKPLLEYTLKLVEDAPLREKMARAALERSVLFSRRTFEERIETFFQPLLKKYGTLP